MVHRSSASQRRLMIGTAMVAVLISLTTGCVSGRKLIRVATFQGDPEPKIMEMAWSSKVQQFPNPVNNGKPEPAIVGRLYLFESESLGHPIIAPGSKLIVESYDDSPGPNGETGRPVEKVTFPSEVLEKMVQKDRIGHGYTIAIPCPEGLGLVHFIVKLESPTGNTLSTTSGTINLDRGVQATNPIVQTGFKR